MDNADVDVINKTVEELFEMVQESKRLLMSWQRTSKLTKAQMTSLRRRTKEYQRKSSSRIVNNFVDNSGVFE